MLGGECNTQLGPFDALFPAKEAILKWMILWHYITNIDTARSILRKKRMNNIYWFTSQKSNNLY